MKVRTLLVALAAAAVCVALPGAARALDPPSASCNGGGCDGWFTSNVSVSWSFNSSGATGASGCGGATVTEDTSEATFTCTVNYGGSFVGMLGDRVFGADKTTRCDFFGAPAILPAGPILLAAMMHCPAVLFFGLYRGGNRYDIYFEHFTDEIALNREHRAAEIQTWMQRYVARLEHYARLAPYNWFNFYSFWD